MNKTWKGLVRFINNQVVQSDLFISLVGGHLAFLKLSRFNHPKKGHVFAELPGLFFLKKNFRPLKKTWFSHSFFRSPKWGKCEMFWEKTLKLWLVNRGLPA